MDRLLIVIAIILTILIIWHLRCRRERFTILSENAHVHLKNGGSAENLRESAVTKRDLKKKQPP
jgi:hypothetical protein